MIDTISSYPNQQAPSKKKNIAIIIIIVVAVAAVVVGILMLRQPQESKQSDVTTSEKEEPTPTEKPEIDKESVKIQVLNGTGTPGQAGTAVDALKKAGYKEENITADNAEDVDNPVTTVTAKAGFEDVANDIKDVLESVFDEVKIESTELDKDSEFDIVVVTGGKKFEEESTPSPTKTSATSTPSPTTPAATSTPSPTPTP